MFNNANQAIGIYELSKGGINSSIIDLRLLLSVTLKCLATSIAIIHNHPSGNLKPSKADISITDKLKKACEVLDIKLLDHIIISKNDYYSFADNGNM